MKQPPAVVLGTGLTALGVTRCLAREGIPVRHVCPGPSELLEASRWYRPLVDDPPPGVEEEPDRLGELIEEHVGSEGVLFPCSDAFAVTAASMSPRLRERYGGYLAGSDVVERIVDKARLAELADRVGIPHPATVPVDSEADLRELGEEWFRGALLKPVDSLRFFRRYGIKSLPVTSREQAFQAFAWFRNGRMRPVLQRYVPGPPTAHLFVDGYRTADGEHSRLLVRRRERMYPPTTGNSSCMVTVRPDEAAEACESLERLFDAVGFRGIFSAEFKEDGEDGTVRLLEVNVRPWWYVEFTARCGVDVCVMAYRDAVGVPVGGRPEYEIGRRCVYVYYDLHAGWSEFRAGRLGMFEWLRSWVEADHPVFARDDPRPALRALRGRIGQFLHGRLRRSAPPAGPEPDR